MGPSGETYDLRGPGPSGEADALVGAGLSGRAGNHTAVGLHVFTHTLIEIFKYIIVQFHQQIPYGCVFFSQSYASRTSSTAKKVIDDLRNIASEHSAVILLG